MAHVELLPDSNETFDIGLILGQRRAVAAVGGRCSAAHAQILRRIRDQKLYRPVARSWRAFCADYLGQSRRHADRLIALLNRFGPAFFEFSQLFGITAEQYLTIEPAVRDNHLLIDGESISVIPANAPKISEAISALLVRSPRPKPASQNVGARLADLTARGRVIAHQLVALYSATASPRERELIVEAATELRLILMQPGFDPPSVRRGA